MTYPKISIVTPSFNQGQYIEKTIQSVLNQNYPNLEYIVIDGGSTDGTVEIIKKYEGRISYWVSEKDRGQSHALNKGFQKATGDIIAWINSDDYYLENPFYKVAELFKNPSVYVVNGNCRMEYTDERKSFIDKSGKISTGRMLKYWKPHFCPPQPAIFFRKKVLEEVGGINETLNYAMDLDLWLKISLKFPFTFIDEVLAGYLVHVDSKSGSAGGFAKFVPEWRMVALNYLQRVSLKSKLKFYLDYAVYRYKGITAR